MTRRWLLVVAVSTSAALVVVTFVVTAVWGPGRVNLNAAQTLVFAVPFMAVGLLVAARRPTHPIGWGFTAAGDFFALQAASIAYADAGLRAGGPHLAGAALAGNLTQWIFAPAVLLGYTLPFLWFPDGQALSRRWRRVAQAAVLTTVASSLGNLLSAGSLNNYPRVDNPVGVDSPAVQLVAFVGVLAYIVCILVAVAAVVIRFRRSVGLERLQMRWFVVGVVFTAFAFVVQLVLLEATGDVGWGVDLLFALPVCAGIAILRYRLFDIDRIISRAVSYLLVTGLLVGIYVGCIAAAEAFVPVGSSLEVAASTLAVAGLFQPVRRRVQSAVDHRFNRQRYDAARTIDAFAGRLRDEVDPDVVRHDLLDATARAIQPASISLWVST